MISIARTGFVSCISKGTVFAWLALAPLISVSSDYRMPDVETFDLTLGVFDFDFARLGGSVAEQFDALQKMGYTGITMEVTQRGQREKLAAYQANLNGRDLRIYAGYVVANISSSNEALYEMIDEAIRSLARSNSALWLIVTESDQDRPALLDVISEIADRAKVAGVELVLYPHDNCKIETAEEAMEYVKELGREDISISLHLCHEIRGGNGDRISEVAQAIKPYLRLPSINGAAINSASDTEEDGWGRTIQPLDKGDYDSSRLIDALRLVGYTGPVILHTFGLQKADFDHHHHSMARFNEMVGPLPPKVAPVRN